jgi:hypothetical protein
MQRDIHERNGRMDDRVAILQAGLEYILCSANCRINIAHFLHYIIGDFAPVPQPGTARL